MLAYPGSALAIVCGGALVALTASVPAIAASNDPSVRLLDTAGGLMIIAGATLAAATTTMLLFNHSAEKYLIDDMAGDPASIFSALGREGAE